MTYQIQSSFDENFKIIANTDPTAITLTTAYQDVPDSHIDYLPSPSSSYVVYQFSTYFASSNGGDTGTFRINCAFKLQYSDDNGSTWSDWGDNTECTVGSNSADVSQRSTLDLKWVLDVSGWTAPKRLRVQAKEATGSTTVLFVLEEFYDSTGAVSGTNKYNNSVSCYSVE